MFNVEFFSFRRVSDFPEMHYVYFTNPYMAQVGFVRVFDGKLQVRYPNDYGEFIYDKPLGNEELEPEWKCNFRDDQIRKHYLTKCARIIEAKMTGVSLDNVEPMDGDSTMNESVNVEGAVPEWNGFVGEYIGQEDVFDCIRYLLDAEFFDLNFDDVLGFSERILELCHYDSEYLSSVTRSVLSGIRMRKQTQQPVQNPEDWSRVRTSDNRNKF